MAVTLDQPVRVGPRSWRLTWSSDKSDPLYRVYRNGRLVGVTKAEEWIFTVGLNESPVIDVLDDASDPGAVLTGVLLIQWRYVAGTEEYRVEEDVSGTWTPVKTLEDDGRTAVFGYATRRLADDTVHTFRVVAVGDDGNESTAASVSARMVRVPDPPDIDYSYDAATGELTATLA